MPAVSAMICPCIFVVVGDGQENPSLAKLAADKVVIQKGRQQLHLLQEQDTTRTCRFALAAIL